MMVDFAVIGAGIVGLATAFELSKIAPGASIVVIDKSEGPARHQTGRNSGVIHSGVYYKPGSFKAEFCKAGNASMKQFCSDYGVPYEDCGKLIVATSEVELMRLEALAQRASLHGLPFKKMGGDALKEVEPHCAGIAALHFPQTAIVDYRRVCEQLVKLLDDRNTEIKFNAQVTRFETAGSHAIIETSDGHSVTAKVAINCGGLQSDRLAKMAGAGSTSRIVPFKGEFFTLSPESSHLVRGLIYPVPDPQLPFVGVHLTKMMRGGIHVGPNAVLSLKREGYAPWSFNFRDAVDVATFGGAWRLASRYLGAGAHEMARSLYKSMFTRDVQRLVPEVRDSDLLPCEPGIRAQLVSPEGALVEDFVIKRAPHAVHVLNAPSPAATASFEIGRHVSSIAHEIYRHEPS